MKKKKQNDGSAKISNYFNKKESPKNMESEKTKENITGKETDQELFKSKEPEVPKETIPSKEQNDEVITINEDQAEKTKKDKVPRSHYQKPTNAKLNKWYSEYKFAVWGSLVENDLGCHVRCRLCHDRKDQAIRPTSFDIKRHYESAIHIARDPDSIKAANHNQRSMADYSNKSGKIKLQDAEIQLACSFGCHCSFLGGECIARVIVAHGKNSAWQEMRMGRTKASAIVKNVISPELRVQLVKAVNGQKFSILVDESTDVSSSKNLAVTIRYYNKNEKKVIDQFLGMESMVKANADAIFTATMKVMNDLGLNKEDLIGIGTDGANVMVGAHNSLWSRMKEIFPDCIVIKCICHSLDLVAKKACDKNVPRDLFELLRGIPAYFSHSGLRQSLYKDYWQIRNPGKSCDIKFPFKPLANTRWLSLGDVIRRILDHWDILLDWLKQQPGSFTDGNVGRLVRYLENPFFRGWTIFLCQHISDIEDVNKKFQQSSADIPGAIRSLVSFKEKLRLRLFVKNSVGTFTKRKEPSLGGDILQYIMNLSNSDAKAIEKFKNDLDGFLTTVWDELELRTDTNLEILMKIHMLSPKNIFADKVIMDEIPTALMSAYTKDRELQLQIQRQYETLKVDQTLFSETLDLEDEVKKCQPETFWSKLLDYELENQEEEYIELSKFALACLSLPLSSAFVERIFSQCAYIKDKYSNRMINSTLTAILYLKSNPDLKKPGCCKNLKVTSDMRARMNATMYEKPTQDDSEDTFFEICEILRTEPKSNGHD